MSEMTLLLVDDIQANIQALSALLESSFDIKIISVNSGHEALKVVLEGNSIDLILCDVQMPEMDGFELASILKQKQSSKDIPIIFITATFESNEFKKKGYDLGAVDYITKPINPNFLISRINSYINISRLQKQLRANAQELKLLNDSLEDKIRQRTDELQKSEARFREMFYAHHAMMLLVDLAEGLIIDANPSASQFYGYTSAQLKQMRISQLEESNSIYKATLKTALEIGASFEAEHRLSNGQTRILEIYSSSIILEGQSALFLIIHDISERKIAEQRINHLAFYDPLTQLPNRRLFEDRLATAILNCNRKQEYAALMFIDLDNFKSLNDTLGHDFGDLLLVEVANRLKHCVRVVDTVARFGGDEFTVLLETMDKDEHVSAYNAKRIAEKVRSALAQPYAIRDCNYRTTPSIGVVLFNGQDFTATELCKHADAAMYKAKESGRNMVVFYDPKMQDELQLRAALQTDLRNALDKNQFSLFYQCQFNGENEVIGAEALLRWQHHQFGFISPGQFIPLAEEIGLIDDIGLWVIEEACIQLRDWSIRPEAQHLTISVNVSARQFKQNNLVENISQLIVLYGIDPQLLKLELTESVFLGEIAECVAIMHGLKGIGVALSMDDFGTGYSSLSYLKQLPLNELKIDQSFVRDLGHDDNDAAIIKAVITLGQVFGLTVIAEGVETEEQYQFLHLNGCHHYQGFLFGKPVPADEFLQQIEHNVKLLANFQVG
ncbi:MAG: EAL domain-containing protein [Methylococcaceae bacterium]|jgi:diguanylate cyclase (GGDEF)-like protein/PAS domain S-box-containing protein